MGRHLATGSITLCGLPREGQTVTHPTKARKDDCPDCRKAYRKSLAMGADRPKEKRPTYVSKNTTPVDSIWQPGDFLRLTDISIWRVDSVSFTGVSITCLFGGKEHRKGATLVIGCNSTCARVTQEALDEVLEAVRAPNRKTKVSQKDVARVQELRAMGYSYVDVEAEMGWPPSNGNRPWRIMHGLVKG